MTDHLYQELVMQFHESKDGTLEAIKRRNDAECEKTKSLCDLLSQEVKRMALLEREIMTLVSLLTTLEPNGDRTKLLNTEGNLTKSSFFPKLREFYHTRYGAVEGKRFDDIFTDTETSEKAGIIVNYMPRKNYPGIGLLPSNFSIKRILIQLPDSKSPEASRSTESK